MAGTMSPISGSMNQIGLGDALGTQMDDETEDQKRKRLLGLSQGAATDLFNFGRTGIGAVASLGLGGGFGRRS